jgi:hypothetical protein
MTEAEIRPFIGKIVAVRWRDPSEDRQLIKLAPKGREGLATWVEWGLVDDVTDEVMRFRHGEALSPEDEHPDEASFGYIHIALIDSIVQMVAKEKKKR